jgi:hypothetical protein
MRQEAMTVNPEPGRFIGAIMAPGARCMDVLAARRVPRLELVHPRSPLSNYMSTPYVTLTQLTTALKCTGCKLSLGMPQDLSYSCRYAYEAPKVNLKPIKLQHLPL